MHHSTVAHSDVLFLFHVHFLELSTKQIALISFKFSQQFSLKSIYISILDDNVFGRKRSQILQILNSCHAIERSHLMLCSIRFNLIPEPEYGSVVLVLETKLMFPNMAKQTDKQN